MKKIGKKRIKPVEASSRIFTKNLRLRKLSKKKSVKIVKLINNRLRKRLNYCIRVAEVFLKKV